MSDQEITSTVDIFKPGLVRNPDGTYTRFVPDPCTPATPEPNSDTSALSKDLPLNLINRTSVRIYLPKQALNHSEIRKLPLIFYHHGGGFVYYSAATEIMHEFCNQLAAETTAMVVSVEYRLAPEHRLPAAYEDSMEALYWVRTTTDPWLTEFADFSNCYLMGTSSGGNIAYHTGLRATAEVDDLLPLKINGLILHHAFFGGSERTGSEIKWAKGHILTLRACDQLWDLSLPVGKDRDHEYCNPMVNIELDKLGQIRGLGWRVLMTGCFGDLLIDRQIEFAKMLEENGVKCVTRFYEGYHGLEILEPSKAKALFDVIQKFMSLLQ